MSDFHLVAKLAQIGEKELHCLLDSKIHLYTCRLGVTFEFEHRNFGGKSLMCTSQKWTKKTCQCLCVLILGYSSTQDNPFCCMCQSQLGAHVYGQQKTASQALRLIPAIPCSLQFWVLIAMAPLGIAPNSHPSIHICSLVEPRAGEASFFFDLQSNYFGDVS